MKVELSLPRAFSIVRSIWPGIALGLIFAASASVALADPVESRLRSQDLVCRAPESDPIRVTVETTVLSNTPCKRIRFSGLDSAGQQTHTVWGCDGTRSSASVRYDFDINDWPARLTVRGPSAVLSKDAQFYTCRTSL